MIVPTIASTIAAVDIINNPKHRQLLDKYCPMFGKLIENTLTIGRLHYSLTYPTVDLVRRYYGFVDEDISEINRIRCVEQQLRSRKFEHFLLHDRVDCHSLSCVLLSCDSVLRFANV